MKIRKIRVSNGIFWIEVPEAGLRLLCGCPADSVKHLIRTGLIVQQEVAGVSCETGPNAILLSDLPLQNGDFCNMAEFPVLQMLYKQGLGIPNHPNNTGAKPLLIGLAEQVSSQMHYIYRGNYGLVSKEEIAQCGIPEARAEEMMRLKRRFAFGHIKATREFMATAVLGCEPIRLECGVHVARQASNVFEIAYGGEAVTVDLNLGEGERYEPPYALGFRKFEREYFGIIHSGEGDGWDINRPSMSSILMFQGKIYMIDAGPHLSATLNALGVGIEEVEGIFQTHAHDDHFAGITTLMRAGHRLKYFATPLVRASVSKKLAALLSLEEEKFNDFFEVCDLTFDSWNDIEGLEVKPLFSPHPVETNIFLFRTLAGNGYKTYAHFADIVSLDVLKGMVTDSPTGPGLTQAAYEQVVTAYQTPADIKKLDIGGGMIHGAAADFRNDSSARVLLAHKAAELTPQEKEIGSNAAFGTADVLIPGKSDTLRRSAFDYLRTYFSDAPLHHVRILLNNEILDLNPGTIILREGETPTDIHVVLSGSIERIRTRDNVFNTLVAGTVLGESSALFERPSEFTYRAATFVQALRIPVALFLEIVQRNGMAAGIRRTIEVRSFLEMTKLFGEGVPPRVLARIADSAERRSYLAGEVIGCRDLNYLNVIVSGRIERGMRQQKTDILQSRDFFGEEGAAFNVPCLFRLNVAEDTTVYQIPGDVLSDIPVVRWKLLESYLGRTQRVIHASDDSDVFVWRDDFSVKLADMDTHHKKLVEIANSVMAALRTPEDAGSLLKATDALVDYTRYHFSSEEALMERYGYRGVDGHKSRHEHLVRQVTDYVEAIASGKQVEVADFKKFFSDWLIRHILNEDRKYAEFLNSQEVF